MITNFRRGLLAAALTFAVLAPAAPAQADEVTLIDGITALPVAEEIRDGYKRELYPHWKDDDKNGCTARNDVLIAEAIEAPTVGAGCSLTGGVWHSYYDDVLVQGPSGIDIDHMVPLAEVHDSGGYGWTTERRRRYANDLGSDVTLVGVTARSNRQKSDQDPATWMPMPAVHCRYLGEWVATKHRWGLAVDPAEREALLRYAADCPNARITYNTAV
ncbi:MULTISPECIES: HNH endonuclease family protein [unclassified Streptomyces]|uniref:HNH endonuclease family protein n=1 Tax=unclassified Streptomyces TaxID=2593676 RepID=UPI002E0F4905|nr:HNH endonuclease family protein [Streptomyces sp. NBC_01207]WTA24210.1 HNH endonuclease family protein [Streptomyces sp. NBC_00853]